jgi:hypothetical protein
MSIETPTLLENEGGKRFHSVAILQVLLTEALHHKALFRPGLQPKGESPVQLQPLGESSILAKTSMLRIVLLSCPAKKYHLVQFVLGHFSQTALQTGNCGQGTVH